MRRIALLLFLMLALPAAHAQASTKGCTVTGTPGADVLVGTPGDDVMCGRGGDDVLRGRAGNDRIKGGPGADRLRGGPDRDVLLGGPGDDDVVRGPGDLLGDFDIRLKVRVLGAKGFPITVGKGSASNCTRNESAGTYTPPTDDWTLELVAVGKWTGSCFLATIVHTWAFSYRADELGEVRFEEDLVAPVWSCQPDPWPRALCEGDPHGLDTSGITVTLH